MNTTQVISFRRHGKKISTLEVPIKATLKEATTGWAWNGSN